jgi:hypothetical protein
VTFLVSLVTPAMVTPRWGTAGVTLSWHRIADRWLSLL